MQNPHADYEIFLFINSGSGSGIGQQLSKIQGPLTFSLIVPKKYYLHIPIQKYEQIVTVHFFNMKLNKNQGFKMLSTFIFDNKRCLGIICGGDGTVTWVISELHQHKIPTDKVPFAVIPLGTGNDFSQNLGWGATTDDLLSNQYKKLKEFLIKMILSQEQDLDIWQVSVCSFQYGKIQKYQGNQHKSIGTVVTRPFVNYFSFGLDGKVGYSFDMHRTQSRLGNLSVYGILGLLKGVTKTKNVNQLLQSFRINRKMVQNGRINLVHSQNQQIIFSSVQKEQKSQVLYQYNQNILALNINSFMGGAKDIWKNSTTQDKSPPPPQDSSDGKLEFVSFPGSLSIGMQKVVGGFAHRVYQGSGPFYFDFKKYDQGLKHRTYLQIDGQFYRFSHPKQVIIQKSHLLQGKFKVLRWKQPKKPKQKGCCGCFA